MKVQKYFMRTRMHGTPTGRPDCTCYIVSLHHPYLSSVQPTSLADSLALSSLTKYLNFILLWLPHLPLRPHTHLHHPHHLQISLLSNLHLKLKFQRSFSVVLTSSLILSQFLLAFLNNVHRYLFQQSPRHIVNLSRSSGQFHIRNRYHNLILKQSVVYPLLKKATLDKDQLSNYRPISNFSLLSKMIQRNVLLNLVWPFL